MSTSRALAARSRAYQAMFNLPPEETLVDEFNCALQQKILLQGKLYISQNFACFHANIFGQETIKVLPASDITGVQLAKILFIPNSIKVFLTYETYFFASFLNRADAYKLLTRISKGESIANMGMWAQGESGADGDDGQGGEDGEGSNAGSDDDDDGGGRGSPPRKSKGGGGHGRSGSMSKSPGPRSPQNGNVVRHASLLSDHAFKVKSEQERKRSEALKETQRQMAAEDSADEDQQRSPPPKRGGGGKGAAAASSGKKAPQRKHSDDDEDEEDAPPPKPRRKIQRDESDSGGSRGGRRSDDESPPPTKRKGAAGAAASSGGKVGKKGGPSAAWLAAASNSALQGKERPSTARIARFYDSAPLPPSGIDPAVADVVSKFKGGKKLGLDAPEARRRLLHQGPMKRQGGWSVVDRWCFLFSDQFLFAEYEAKADKPRYREKQRVLLMHAQVDMRPSGFQGESLASTKLPNAFRILDNDPAQPVQYICSTLTPQEKIDWGRRLGEAISRWHFANPAASKVNTKEVGWYTQFVRGMLPHAVIHAEDPDLLLQLLRNDAQKDHINDLDQEGNSLLHLAVRNNTPALINTLVTHGASLTTRDYDNYTPLHVAVIQGNLPCVHALLGCKGMDPSVWHPMNPSSATQARGPLREQSCLWIAAVTHFKSSPSTADQLMRALLSTIKGSLAQREFLDERSEGNDMTLLDYCCFNTGMTGVATTLLQLGASVDLHNLEGLTPLSQACKYGNLPMVTLLLRHGAQPNLRHHKHGLNSPLFYCGSGSSALECARELVAYGARWNDGSKNREGLRIRDLFPSTSAQKILRSSEEHFASLPAVENSWDNMKPPATSMPANNRHEFESCCLCQIEFTLVNKREYCRRCGWNICAPCSTKRMVFVSSSSGGKSRNSAPAGPAKERACDGCYNLTAYEAKSGARRQAAASSAVAAKKRADSAANDDEDDDAAGFRKPVRSAAAARDAGSDEEDTRFEARGGQRAEHSKFKSIKRLNVDSDDDEPQHSEPHSSDEEPPPARKGAAASAARGKPRRDDSDRDASAPDDDDDAPNRSGGKKGDESKSSGFGGFMSRFSKKDASADKAPEKSVNKSKARPADSEEESDDAAERAANKRRKQAAAAAGAAGAAAASSAVNGRGRAPASRPAADDDDDDDTPANRTAGRPPGWSRAAAAEADSDPTDSDAGKSCSDDDARSPKTGKKAGSGGNIFQRGLASASNTVKSAGGAVGGAMTKGFNTVKSGVTKVAHTVHEKVTAVTVPVDDGGEDSDPAAAQKARRKEAARERVRARRAAEAEEDDVEEEPKPRSANEKAGSTAARMSEAKRNALRNQELLDGMERKGDEVEEGGREFQSLASKLKAKQSRF